MEGLNTSGAGEAMREVEIRLKSGSMADVLGALRTWLDHSNCIPLNFDIDRSAFDGFVVRIQFREDEMAEAFSREFAG
ncbi:MAG: hypothetical protein JO166_18005 [Deltaproteobacteria bacterium]|nr:hypothetical protein [Deltaproteobacteria bacterium]